MHDTFLTVMTPDTDSAKLSSLSVVIPARNEEGCISSTVEHLPVELRIHGVPHEIIVVDDGSTDRTWEMLDDLKSHMSTLKPVQNTGPNGFGRAVIRGLDQMPGDAAVIMMADESDDCRDVVRYWELLNQGWDAVFRLAFHAKGRRRDRLSLDQAADEPAGQFIYTRDVRHQAE